jgi:hypothetical protein
VTRPTSPLDRLGVVAVSVLLCGSVAACASNPVPSASPAQASIASSNATAASASTDPSPSTSESTVPSTAASPAVSATPAAATCAIATQRVRPPSDRLIDIIVRGNANADLVRFVFGEPSLEGSGGPPTSVLQRAKRPYTKAGSGKPMALLGQRVAQVRFDHMSNMNDIGEPTYQGPAEVRPKLPELRDVALYDDSEGVVGWYIGFNGRGCATLSVRGSEVIVTIEHG